MDDSIVQADVDRKEVIEELKVVQDILLKQEAYAVGALHQALVVVAGLAIALFSEKTKMGNHAFLVISEAVVIGFLYVQAIYREAFFQGLERSRFLQDVLGKKAASTSLGYEPFSIYENVHHPVPTWKTFLTDIQNPRFLVPNAMLFAIPVLVVYFRS